MTLLEPMPDKPKQRRGSLHEFRWTSKRCKPAAEPVPAVREPFNPVEIFSYDDLWRALRNRVDNLGISQGNVDALLGHADGYAQKVLSLSKTRRLGMETLAGFLSALSVKLVILEDPDALERNRSRYKQRDVPHYRAARSGHDKAELKRWAAERGLTVVISK
jgi:hypothetical protein